MRESYLIRLSFSSYLSRKFAPASNSDARVMAARDTESVEFEDWALGLAGSAIVPAGSLLNLARASTATGMSQWPDVSGASLYRSRRPLPTSPSSPLPITRLPLTSPPNSWRNRAFSVTHRCPSSALTRPSKSPFLCSQPGHPTLSPTSAHSSQRLPTHDNYQWNVLSVDSLLQDTLLFSSCRTRVLVGHAPLGNQHTALAEFQPPSSLDLSTPRPSHFVLASASHERCLRTPSPKLHTSHLTPPPPNRSHQRFPIPSFACFRTPLFMPT
ncbi:hypothetical protein NMY22_g15807 [Coprinellus aureogranulatus]|nr:hypothetical protein NMY22_g15807 [Coprinellus aureogranulatus]